MIMSMIVSVPYWGSLYFNDTNEVITLNESYIVSVPYWGSLYFNEKRENDYAYNCNNSFRPLLGFFIFQLEKQI